MNSEAVATMNRLLRNRPCYDPGNEAVVLVLERQEDISAVAESIHQVKSHKLISTAMTKSPLEYSPDYGSLVPDCVEFVRITTSRVLDKSGQIAIQDRMAQFACKATLRVIPEQCVLTGPAGLFVRMRDGSHFCFIALKDPRHIENSRYILISGCLALLFFQYYDSLEWTSD